MYGDFSGVCCYLSLLMCKALINFFWLICSCTFMYFDVHKPSFQVSLLMCLPSGSMHELLCSVFSSFTVWVSYIHSLASHDGLSFPCISTYRPHSIVVSGPVSWNSILSSFRSSTWRQDSCTIDWITILLDLWTWLHSLDYPGCNSKQKKYVNWAVNVFTSLSSHYVVTAHNLFLIFCSFLSASFSRCGSRSCRMRRFVRTKHFWSVFIRFCKLSANLLSRFVSYVCDYRPFNGFFVRFNVWFDSLVVGRQTSDQEVALLLQRLYVMRCGIYQSVSQWLFCVSKVII